MLEEVHESMKAGRGGALYISLIAGFSRMRELLKAYGGKENPRNVEQIAKALETSELLEVVDGNAVKRRDFGIPADIDLGTEDGMNAYREAKVAELDKRFVFVSPFARDTSIEQVQEYFASVGKPAQSIRLRRHAVSKDFRGSIFVEFATEEEARAMAARTDLEFQGATLSLQLKSDYLAEKRKEAEERKAKQREEAIARGDDPDAPPPKEEWIFVGKVSKEWEEKQKGLADAEGGRGGGHRERSRSPKCRLGVA